MTQGPGVHRGMSGPQDQTSGCLFGEGSKACFVLTLVLGVIQIDFPTHLQLCKAVEVDPFFQAMWGLSSSMGDPTLTPCTES